MPPAIAAHGLTKRFPRRRPLSQLLRRPFADTEVTALEGVTLEVEPGEVFAVLGPNGGGKTTLLRILATQLLPSAGSARVAGHDVAREPRRARAALGYCIDADRSFYYRLTPVQNLEFFAALAHLSPAEARERIPWLLELVGLDSAARQPFMTFSKGMRQKLALARALLNDPPVLLLDEPTQNLDPGATAGFRKLLRERLVVQRRKTILLVTHDLEEAYACADRGAILVGGRFAFEGRVAQLRDYIRERGFPGGEPEAAP